MSVCVVCVVCVWLCVYMYMIWIHCSSVFRQVYVIMNEATMHCIYVYVCMCVCVCVCVCVYRYVVHDGLYTFVVVLPQRCVIIITLYSWRKGVG